MLRRFWPVPVVAAAAVGVLFALGVLGGGDGGPGGRGAVLRSAEEPEAGPSGPARTHGTEGPGTDPTLVGVPGAKPPPGPRELRDVGEVVVTVVDAAGVPLPNRWVSVFVDDVLRETVVTGRDGKVVLKDLPRNGGAYLALGRHAMQPESVTAVQGGTARLKAAQVLRLRVDLVDAESSARLGHARWRFTSPVLAGTTDAIASGVETPVKATPGRRLTRPYAAVPTPDYVDADPAWSTYVSRYATSLTAVHPLRREAKVTVLVTDKDKEPVRDAQVTAWNLAHHTETSPETGLYLLGGVPLSGVPYYRGEELDVWVRSPDGKMGRAQARLPADPHEELEIEVQVGSRDLPFVRDAEITDHVETDEDLVPLGSGPDPLHGTVRIVVTRADGSPAVGARVMLPVEGEHRADAEGILTVSGILAGTYRAWLNEPGLVPVETTFEIRGEEETVVDLREPWGATLEVTVKGADGTPLPYAQVNVTQALNTPWVDLDRDVQRLDPYTDHEGRKTLRRLQPGFVVVTGHWASRSAEKKVHVEERATRQVTLLLR